MTEETSSTQGGATRSISGRETMRVEGLDGKSLKLLSEKEILRLVIRVKSTS